MSVPQDIRAVPRPKNTVVTDTGSKGPLRYCVRARTKAVRTAKGFQPRNGKVIGHIVDGAFVPVSSRMKAKERRTLGCALLVADLGSDLRARLAAHLGDKDADLVLALASLDILHPDLGEDLRAAQYKASLASLVFPGLDLSEKSIHALYTKIGKKGADELFRSLGQANGSDTSSYLLLMPMECPATLAAFGKDACKDNGPGLCLALQGGDTGFEPVYGRLLDMKGEGLPGAATCCDTGCTLFTASEASSESLRSLARERGLHYLVPVKRDDKLCKKLSFDDLEVVDGADTPCRKKRSPDDEYLYAFAGSPAAPAKQAQSQTQGKKKKNKKARENVRVFRSDVDLPLSCIPALAHEEALWQRILAHLAPLLLSACTLKEREREGAGPVFLVTALVLRRIVQRAHDTGLLGKTHMGRILAALGLLQCHVEKGEPDSWSCSDFRPALSCETASMLQKLGFTLPEVAEDKPI